LGRGLTPSSHQLRYTGCRPLLEWTLTGCFAKGRLSRHGLPLYNLGSLERKKVRFRFQPECHVPSLRATCVFPKLGSQPGDSVLVCGSFGYAISIHGNKYEPALKQQAPPLITYILGLQQQWHRTCRPGRHPPPGPRVLAVIENKMRQLISILTTTGVRSERPPQRPQDRSTPRSAMPGST
jgi:hypothetical protein